MKNFKLSNVALAVIVLVIVMLILIPLSPGILDVMLVINISVSLLIMVTVLYTKEPLEFSVFPTLLLIVTLFRLALNISSTRLILSNGGQAGKVIETFGNFVIGSNLVVGIIIFLIIVVIQFVVITKGAERVSEVGARFTLDAMPGKQMAIDADLNSGLIDEQGAKERRAKIQEEASFYGAMDGASKFVKGDAIVGILITLINAVGGIIIGITTGGMPINEVISIYTLATVGDGLVSQIPALLVSTATGIIVTRATSEGGLGDVMSRQLFSSPRILMVAGGMVIALSLIPGLPKFPLWILGGIFITLGVIHNRSIKQAETVPAVDTAEEAAQEKRRPESVTSLLQVDPIELEFGYGIIPLVDSTQGGDLLDRVVMIRRQCAMDMGIIVPVIRLRDNIQLGTNEYVVKIKGVDVARGEVIIDHFLALNSGNATGPVKGIETVEPAFGLPAHWITPTEREKAELMGYTIIDPPSVIATHLTEIIKRHAHELLSRQQVQTLLDNLKRTQSALVEEVVPKLFSLGELQKVLGNLLREGVPIRDMGTILETLSDYGSLTRDLEVLTEYVRQNLKRVITRRFVPDNTARVITLEPALEQIITERIKQTERGSYVAMEPDQIQGIFVNLKSLLERQAELGVTPIVLTSPSVRRHFKRMTEQLAPDLVVLSYNELEQNIEIYSDGMVSL